MVCRSRWILRSPYLWDLIAVLLRPVTDHIGSRIPCNDWNSCSGSHRGHSHTADCSYTATNRMDSRLWHTRTHNCSNHQTLSVTQISTINDERKFITSQTVNYYRRVDCCVCNYSSMLAIQTAISKEKVDNKMNKCTQYTFIKTQSNLTKKIFIFIQL